MRWPPPWGRLKTRHYPLVVLHSRRVWVPHHLPRQGPPPQRSSLLPPSDSDLQWKLQLQHTCPYTNTVPPPDLWLAPHGHPTAYPFVIIFIFLFFSLFFWFILQLFFSFFPFVTLLCLHLWIHKDLHNLP